MVEVPDILTAKYLSRPSVCRIRIGDVASALSGSHPGQAPVTQEKMQ